MSYFVEVVTEDLFYENLTLGVVRVLESSPCVKNVQIDRRNPCEKAALAAWEQRHGCILPEDLRNFYSSIDGFLLTWSFEVAGNLSKVKHFLFNFSTLKKIKLQKPPATSKL